jgi:integrase/recombinase XerD
MPKQDRRGQAAIISDETFIKLTRSTPNRKWKLFFSIAWHTGERHGAIRQLEIRDVYNSDGSVKEYITYRPEIRKHAAGKTPKARHVWINDTLKAILSAYPKPEGGFLFPGRIQGQPMTLSACDKQFRHFFDLAGLINGGYSLHSFRRTFITRLADNGVSIKVIQAITGHEDVRSLMPYIEVSDQAVRNAMAAIA